MKLPAIAAVAITALFSANAASAACSLKAQAIAVAMQGLRPIVTPKINGQEAQFLLDSGSAVTAVNGALAAKLGLKPLRIAETGSHIGANASVRMVGAAGVDALEGVVVAPKFEFEGAKFKDVPLLATNRLPQEGLLGQAFLRVTDVEYDLGHGQFKLVKPEGCADASLVYWAKPGQSYSLLPLDEIDRDDPRTTAPVYVNGVKMRAVFDTGAALTFITENAAARAGIKTSDPAVQPVGDYSGLDGDGKAWVATFKSVKIGDEDIQNGQLMIGRSATTSFDVLIGADFFLSHHLYVANSQHKIYLTYEGGQVFRTPTPAVAAK